MNYLLSTARRTATALLVLLPLVLGGFLAVPAVADEQIYEPIYPVGPSDAPLNGQDEDKEKGTIRVPDLVAEEGDFHLAVIDSVQAQIDNQEVLDAVRETMGQTNAKIVVGVDTADNTMEGGAAQFIRALTLFGPTSYLLLHDDWPDSTDTKGYIQDGWIVIGLMLPDKDGHGAEIAIDKAWNVTGDRSAALSNSVAALRPMMDKEDYTQAVIESVRITTEELKAPKNILGVLLPASSDGKRTLLFVVLGVLGTLLTTYVVLRGARKRQRQATTERSARAAQLARLLPQQLRELESCKLPAISVDAGGVIQQRAELLERAISPLAKAGQEAVRRVSAATPVSSAELERLEGINRCQEELVSACTAFNGLLGTANPSRQRWGSIISAHRRLLDDCAQFLDRADTASLDAAARVRGHLVTDTDALDEAQQWLEKPMSRRATPVDMLERLWELRLALTSDLEQLLEQAGRKRIKVPHELAAHRTDRPEDGTRRLDDLATLDQASREVQRWMDGDPGDRA
ncbi:hypothetical protein [Glutamicibacter protophormiae]|uniref:hypothetical protein n=1 Tax=Glutamicibacter protophormiae TaxID=37930 RepID=UPI00195C5D1A|nr:hypothetical protein [Glutamicibacter protophormiae]QRQ78143.1 hypothetical protein JQN66_14690 [Glutamicibacter protophormiae]